MPTAHTTWNVLVTIVRAPSGATSAEAYPYPAVRCPALRALTIRAAATRERPLPARVREDESRSSLAARRIRKVPGHSRRGGVAFAPEVGCVAEVRDALAVRRPGPARDRLELDVRPDVFRRSTGISRRAPGASSSPNSSGTGEFPFGTGRGNVAPGGVAPVRTAADFHDDHPFSTN